MNCFQDGYDATTEDGPQEEKKEEEKEDRFQHYGQLVPAGVYGWGG